MFQKTLPGVQDLGGMPTTGRGMRRRLPPRLPLPGARYHSNGSQPPGLPGSASSSRNAARAPPGHQQGADGETADVRSASRLAHPVARGLVHRAGLL